MILGISSFTFPWAIGVEGYLHENRMTVTELLQKAIEFEVGALQIGDNMPVHLLKEWETEKLIIKAAINNIGLQLGMRGLKHEKLKEYIYLASKLNSQFVRVVIDEDGFHPTESEVIEVIKSILPLLKEKKILLAIENHDRFPALSLEKIIKNTSEQWVGICLDTANSIGAGEGINEVLNVLGKYTVNLHIKDFQIKRLNHKMGFIVEGCAAGDGMLDIPSLISEIKKYKKCKSATLELWSGHDDCMETTIAKENEWAKQSINYLKTILK